jgi:hypothetical protein
MTREGSASQPAAAPTGASSSSRSRRGLFSGWSMPTRSDQPLQPISSYASEQVLSALVSEWAPQIPKLKSLFDHKCAVLQATWNITDVKAQLPHEEQETSLALSSRTPAGVMHAPPFLESTPAASSHSLAYMPHSFYSPSSSSSTEPLTGGLLFMRTGTHLRCRAEAIELHMEVAMKARATVLAKVEENFRRDALNARSRADALDEEVTNMSRNAPIRMEVEQAVLSAMKLHQSARTGTVEPPAISSANHPLHARATFTVAVLDEHWPETMTPLPSDLLIDKYAPTDAAVDRASAVATAAWTAVDAPRLGRMGL